MGRLENGKWLGENESPAGKDGAFVRASSVFRNWITPDGSPGPSGTGGFAAESGRYHLYVSLACPWAHRTLVFRVLKGLEDHISVDVVHPFMGADGWTFQRDGAAQGDSVLGGDFLREVYLAADSKATSRVSVPVLWDKRTGTIVSNESAEIIRMFNSAFDGLTGNTNDYWPAGRRDGIEAVNERIYNCLNNGVYRAGFATSQVAYDIAATEVFETLDWIEARLAGSRYLMGDTLTEADWRLATTLFRFDLVYAGHFKCNRRRIVDYPRLWAYARELYQHPGVAGTVDFDHITRHYHTSHESINPHRIVPVGPDIDWNAPHGRQAVSAA